MLSTKDSHGEDFKLLGVLFDYQLSMAGALHALVGKARWKLGALLKSSAYHYDTDLVLLYKSKLLSYLEYRTPAVYHATDTLLEPLNELQNKLLRTVGCSEVEALMLWNLAPLATRRDVAMLGVVHRAVLKQGPEHFQQFFAVREEQSTHWTRAAARRERHDKQLKRLPGAYCPELRRRSALGLIQVYNLLPAEAVAESFVKEFRAS